MARKRYRRRTSPSSSLLRDTTEIADRLPWWQAALFGAVVFAFLYFAMPPLLGSLAKNLEGNPYAPIVNLVLERREWLFHWLAIAVALVSGYFTARNYFSARRAGRVEKQTVGFLARLLGRSID